MVARPVLVPVLLNIEFAECFMLPGTCCTTGAAAEMLSTLRYPSDVAVGFLGVEVKLITSFHQNALKTLLSV